MIQTESQTQAEMPPEKKESRAKSLIKQVVMIAAAVGLLYFSFRGCDLASIWAYSVKSNPYFLAFMMINAVISHLFRSIRWCMLLKPLADHKISLFNSFTAVMMGYAVNIVVPRGGEVARLVSISQTEKLPVAGVLPTMFIDRLLDIAMLALLLGITLMTVPKEMFGELPPWLVPGGIALTVATFAGLAVLPHVSKIMLWFINLDFVRSKLQDNWRTKLEDLSDQFGVGTKSLTNPVAYLPIAALSFAIWGCYWLNLWFTILAFNIQDKVTPLNTLITFTIGSIGVLVPTPGSVGGYHYLLKTGLMKTSGINADLALAVATLNHFICFILVACIPAAICLAIQSTAKNKAASKQST
ncbi:MAG: hypothetical protein C0469_12805 [Cyanobacteria bacterium DS2.3.42]|nr:hypothetical protein [Cyanobacteria bacterium DS2.3.42]